MHQAVNKSDLKKKLAELGLDTLLTLYIISDIPSPNVTYQQLQTRWYCR